MNPVIVETLEGEATYTVDVYERDPVGVDGDYGTYSVTRSISTITGPSRPEQPFCLLLCRMRAASSVAGECSRKDRAGLMNLRPM